MEEPVASCSGYCCNAVISCYGTWPVCTKQLDRDTTLAGIVPFLRLQCSLLEVQRRLLLEVSATQAKLTSCNFICTNTLHYTPTDCFETHMHTVTLVTPIASATGWLRTSNSAPSSLLPDYKVHCCVLQSSTTYQYSHHNIYTSTHQCTILNS